MANEQLEPALRSGGVSARLCHIAIHQRRAKRIKRAGATDQRLQVSSDRFANRNKQRFVFRRGPIQCKILLHAATIAGIRPDEMCNGLDRADHLIRVGDRA